MFLFLTYDGVWDGQVGEIVGEGLLHNVADYLHFDWLSTWNCIPNLSSKSKKILVLTLVNIMTNTVCLAPEPVAMHNKNSQSKYNAAIFSLCGAATASMPRYRSLSTSRVYLMKNIIVGNGNSTQTQQHPCKIDWEMRKELKVKLLFLLINPQKIHNIYPCLDRIRNTLANKMVYCCHAAISFRTVPAKIPRFRFESAQLRL